MIMCEAQMLHDQTNGDSKSVANELDQVLEAVRPLILNFVSQADTSGVQVGQSECANGLASGCHSDILLDAPPPHEVEKALALELPVEGLGLDGLVSVVTRVLGLSVNTWHQGFMDKLYASTNAAGLASELILAALNTNVHVYSVSPALTVVEKAVSRALTARFGLDGPFAGGLTQPGGSGSNLTALVVARNTLFPETKIAGNAERKLVLFTSADGHYSFEKAAQICGLGSNAVWPVAVDEHGRMRPDSLEQQVCKARQEGFTPFFVNATSGTTVLGSFDPLQGVGAIARRESLWFHVDASWGGGVVFSDRHRGSMRGSELADSLTFNPHKMLNVPIQCSFLLMSDVRKLWKSNTLPASYLFHGDDSDEAPGSTDDAPEFWDLGDLSLQCGRRGDALKMALAWVYYGTRGFEQRIDEAFCLASRLASLVERHADLELVSANPPPCLQVCFYSAPQGQLGSAEQNSKRTRQIARELRRGPDCFMVDFAPGQRGLFLRAVIGLQTQPATLERLVRSVTQLGARAPSDCLAA